MESMFKKFLVGIVEDNTATDCPLFADARFVIDEISSYEEFHEKIVNFCDAFSLQLRRTGSFEGMYMLKDNISSVAVTGTVQKGEPGIIISVVSFN